MTEAEIDRKLAEWLASPECAEAERVRPEEAAREAAAMGRMAAGLRRQ